MCETPEVLLAGREGNQLEMAVLGYQFPDEQTDPWDSNWLLVGVRVVSPAGSWEVVDPCLTTWEAASLVGWLVKAVGHSDQAGPMTFTEPNLCVSVRPKPRSPKRVLMSAQLALELRPPWSGAAGADRLDVDLDLDRADLARAAASLLADVVRFPRRGDPPQ
ncbi:MAG: WapI family immunity protein [Acidimicrobiales bacterium]